MNTTKAKVVIIPAMNSLLNVLKTIKAMINTAKNIKQWIVRQSSCPLMSTRLRYSTNLKTFHREYRKNITLYKSRTNPKFVVAVKRAKYVKRIIMSITNRQGYLIGNSFIEEL
jgi:hypothetical protein